MNEDRKVVFCGSYENKLYISTRKGVVLREVDLPIAGYYLDTSQAFGAVGSAPDDGRPFVVFVNLESGAFSPFPLPSDLLHLKFNESGTRLACGLTKGLSILHFVAN